MKLGNKLKTEVHHKIMAVAIAMCFTNTSHAQSSDGSIFGRSSSKEEIQIINVESGVSRTVVADKEGNFVFSKLPPGRYQVRAGSKVRNVSVAIGSGSEVKFDEVATITITANRNRSPIDVSSTESNSVFTLAEIQAIPVARNPSSVALLAPGAVAGDSAFGNLPSFGGASVAENGYYINGFDVTNMRTFTNYASLPFDAISEEQVKTGGYGAEFGRSLGGVISVLTKRGTNTWRSGASISWSPSWGTAGGKTVINQDKEAWVTSKLPSYTVFNPKQNNSENINYSVYSGGPLIKDKLFFFGLLEGRRNTTDTFGGATSTRTTSQTPNGMVKLDWQISTDHRLEFTGIYNKETAKNSTWTNVTDEQQFSVHRHGSPQKTSMENGGDVEILKYTGYLTDNLTLSAQFGRLYNLANKLNDPYKLGVDCPVIEGANSQSQFGCWNPIHQLIRDQKAPDDSDNRRGKRLDLEYTIGKHTIRTGWDGQEFTSTNAGQTFSGGVAYRYKNMPANREINGIVGAGSTNNDEYVMMQKYVILSGRYVAKNDAIYLEDSWKVSKDFLAYGGIRSETFENRNSENISFVKRKNLLAPRLGASLDVNGDASFKLYASAGRYFIPVATNTNIAVTSIHYIDSSFYNFDGKDSKTLAPLNLGPVIGNNILAGNLVSPNPGTLTDTKLSPMSQDEFIAGFQKALSKDLFFGLKTVFRKVNNGMDDFCGKSGIAKWAIENGYNNLNTNSMAECVLMNPGRTLNLKIDANGDGKLVDASIPNSYLGLEKYTRMYRAIELSADRPFDGKWGLSGSYVFSKSVGTAEGYVQSDQSQASAGISQDFDFGSLTHGSYGTLPNSRTHQIKLFGRYAINDNLSLGANLGLASGRSTSCIGYAPTSVSDYFGPDGTTNGGVGGRDNASSYYCLDTGGTSVLGKRGNGPTMPWTKSLDLNLTYTRILDGGRSFTLQANFFNVFNTQTVTLVNQFRDYSRYTSLDSTGNKLNPNYGSPISFSRPRSLTVTAKYEF